MRADGDRVYAIFDAGDMEHREPDAAFPIEELIDTLLGAQEDGVTHVYGVVTNASHATTLFLLMGFTKDR